MAIYKIHMRSFAPWRQFGALLNPSRVQMPMPSTNPPIPYPRGSTITLGGSYHGDGRGFSLDVSSGTTARVHAYLEVDVTNETAVAQRVWCDKSHGPWMAVGPSAQATGTAHATFSVTKTGSSVLAVIEYAASNPLVTGAPNIDARGEFTFVVGADELTLDATITGDQFPACESFVEDKLGKKIFVGGFAPSKKGQLGRLFGSMNKPKKIWFDSHVVLTVDAYGSFLDITGGGSGSNLTGPACEMVAMSVNAWNVRIMGSIPMPADAP